MQSLRPAHRDSGRLCGSGRLGAWAVTLLMMRYNVLSENASVPKLFAILAIVP